MRKGRLWVKLYRDTTEFWRYTVPVCFWRRCLNMVEPQPARTFPSCTKAKTIEKHGFSTLRNISQYVLDTRTPKDRRTCEQFNQKRARPRSNIGSPPTACRRRPTDTLHILSFMGPVVASYSIVIISSVTRAVNEHLWDSRTISSHRILWTVERSTYLSWYIEMQQHRWLFNTKLGSWSTWGPSGVAGLGWPRDTGTLVS